MDIANFIGILTFFVSIIAAYYAFKTFRAGQEPRLALSYSPNWFTLRNIGTVTARNIKNNYLLPKNISELFNFTGPVGIASSSVAMNMNLQDNLEQGKEIIAIFEYENLSGQKFQSKFAVKKAQDSNSAEPYTVREIVWKRN